MSSEPFQDMPPRLPYLIAIKFHHWVLDLDLLTLS